VAYRIKPKGSPGKQLSRIVRQEFERVVSEMRDATDEIEAVHDARKRIKKIRAILHLLRRPLGRVYQTYDNALRKVAHQLSAARDADAALEVMKAVHTQYPSLVTRSMFEGVRRGLTPKQRAAALHFRPTRVRRELEQMARTMARSIRRAAEPAAVRAGIAHGYARARKAMHAVKATPEDTGFHAWRRRVKDHWYHMRLLEAVHPRVRTRVRELQRLEHWLGDDHNLVLLRATVLKAPSEFGDKRATSVVLGCMAKYQATLRKRALKLGERLFAGRRSGL
jgi:CHAD domain-containing protein